MDEDNRRNYEEINAETNEELRKEASNYDNWGGEPRHQRMENNGLPNNNAQYYVMPEKKGGLPGWAKFLIIFAAIIAGCFLLITGCTNKIEKAIDSLNLEDFTQSSTEVKTIDIDEDYIGVLHIEGTIDEDSATKDYNHKYLLDTIDDMIVDDHNKGIILFLNTPGGTVFGSDEMYLKIKEYQEKTGRPVYSSMQSQCTSGGYYISAPCDKIIANRNCWTGSIGVTMGSMYDISGLLDELGIKVNTITAGKNKAMGSSVEPMTKEQREILQSLVDDSYEQFTGIVAEGRNMKLKDVKELADGRVYTANQALELGLIDEIGTFDEAVEMMKKDYKLVDDIRVEDFQKGTDTDWMSMLGIVSELAEQKANSGITSPDAIEELVGLNNKFEVSYMAPIQK